MLRWPLRTYQTAAVRNIIVDFAANTPAIHKGPTGCGKSMIHAGVLENVPGCYVTVPNIDIARGICSALGHEVKEMDDKELRPLSEAGRIYTTKRLLGLLSRGTVAPPKFLLHDESHHVVDAQHKLIHDLCGNPPFCGLTATDYRGTPAGTAELLSFFGGRVREFLTLKDAVAGSFVSLPTFSTVPVLDDELISVSNGEFVVSAVNLFLKDRVRAIAALVAEDWSARPTTVVLPSLQAIDLVARALAELGVPTVTVVSSTKNRGALFAEVLANRAVLLQIRAIGEGVDLPLRRMYDFSPTMSPVLWYQRVGRVTRFVGVGNPAPEYICGCHNLLRHGYLFCGMIPRAAFKQAQTVWGADWKPSRQIMSRALGLQGLGRFEPIEVAMISGEKCYFYAMKGGENGLMSYAALLIPHAEKPYYFSRNDSWDGTTRKWQKTPTLTLECKNLKLGRWARIPAIPDVQGYASYPTDPATPYQQSQWERFSEKHGLAKCAPTRKQNLLLKILQDTNMRVA